MVETSPENKKISRLKTANENLRVHSQDDLAEVIDASTDKHAANFELSPIKTKQNRATFIINRATPPESPRHPTLNIE